MFHVKHSFDITGFQLKIAAIIAMTCNHVANVFGGMLPAQLDFALYAVGGVTFPIMAFLLVEGYAHTSNVRSYAVRLGIFALISQVPYYLVFQWPLNVLFTLLIGLGILWLNDQFHPAVGLLVTIVCTIGLQGVVDWGTVGFVVIYFFGALREARRMPASFAKALVGEHCGAHSSAQSPIANPLEHSGNEHYETQPLVANPISSSAHEHRSELSQTSGATAKSSATEQSSANAASGSALEKIMPAKQRQRDLFVIIGTMTIPMIVTCLTALRFSNVLVFGYATIGYSIATVLLCGYRGRRGRPMKWFFYAYYPLHLFAIWIAAVILL